MPNKIFDKDIFIIRHGETDWNLEHRMQGSTDTDINQTGARQASAIADMLASYAPEVIIASGLQRARRTAEIINKKLALPIITDERLAEISFGDYNGALYDDIVAEHGQEMFNRFTSPEALDMGINLPTAEPKAAAQLRAYGAIIEHISKLNAKRIIIVSHGLIIRLFLAHVGLKDIPFIGNGDIYHLKTDSVGKNWAFIESIDNSAVS